MKLSRHHQVALSAWSGRMVSAVAQLGAVRMLLGQIGTESYAAWAVIVSLTGWFLLSDLGASQAVQNVIARAIAQGRSPDGEIRQAVQHIWRASLGLCVIVVATCPWTGDLLLSNSVADPVLRRECLAMGGLLLTFGSWTSFAAKIWYAQDRGLRANALPAVTALVSLAAVALVPGRVLPQWQLPVALLGWLAPPAIVGAGSMLSIVRGLRHGVVQPESTALLRRALAFWFYAVLGVATLNVDYIILARTVSAPELVSYNLLSKIFGFLFFFYTATLAVYSPRISAASATNQLGSVFLVLRRHMAICSVVLVVVTALFWLKLPYLLARVFHAGDAKVSPMLFGAMFALYFVRVWADGYAMFLAALDQLSLLGRFLPAQATISVGLETLLAYHIGALGVVVGLLASYLLTVSWGFPVLTRSLLFRISST